MIADIAAEFGVDPSIVMLNHASFGLAARSLMDAAESRRRAIERDPLTELGDPLRRRLRAAADRVAVEIGARPGSVGLVANSTEASAAVAASLMRGRPIRVLTLSTEYSAVLRAWAVRVQTSGGQCEVIDMPLPLADAAMLTAFLEAVVHDDFDVFVVSLITSSTAIVMPVAELVQWAGRRGMVTVVDAAHAVGHLELDVATLGADVVFGTLHKWLPVPRPAGFLWLSEALRAEVRPAVVALNWDDDELSTRFGWRGTWDPAAVLGVGDALAMVEGWRAAGRIRYAVGVADQISDRLVALGLTPTASPALVPPRLRGFLMPDPAAGTSPAAGTDLTTRLETVLRDAGIRASVGRIGDRTLLRLSTHIFNSEDDVDTLELAVMGVVTA